MKQGHPDISLQRLCLLFGVTRQTYYEAQLHENKTSIAHMIVLTLVKELRATMPMLGTRKLLFLITPELQKHGIKWVETNSLICCASMDYSCVDADVV